MKTLNYFIPAIFLGFIVLTLSYDNSVYGIWIRQSPQELLNQSSTIFVGNIASTNVLHLEKNQSYNIEENGTDKTIVQNYTLNLDEYRVDVEEFLKNPQNTNKITVRQPTIGLPTGLGGLDGFNTGDRVLFYVKNLDGINEYSPESFIIPKSCIAKDVLTQKRPESRGESIAIQNGMKVDYSNFTANKPVQFIDNEDVDTLSGKSLDFQVYLTKTVGSGTEVVFNKEIHAESKPCEWVASAKWEFTPQVGEYGMAVMISEDNKTYSQYYTKFSVKSDVMTHDQMSPLKQFKSGSIISQITCSSNLQPLIKLENGQPSCVKTNHVARLVSQNWRETSNVIFGCPNYPIRSTIDEEKGFVNSPGPIGLQYVLKPNSTAYVTIEINLCVDSTQINESKYFMDYHEIFKQQIEMVKSREIAKFISPGNDTNAIILTHEQTKWLSLDLVNATKINDHTLTEIFVISADYTAPRGLYSMPLNKCPPVLLTIGDSLYKGHIALLDLPLRSSCPPGSLR